MLGRKNTGRIEKKNVSGHDNADVSNYLFISFFIDTKLLKS